MQVNYILIHTGKFYGERFNANGVKTSSVITTA